VFAIDTIFADDSVLTFFVKQTFVLDIKIIIQRISILPKTDCKDNTLMETLLTSSVLSMHVNVEKSETKKAAAFWKHPIVSVAISFTYVRYTAFK